MIEALNSGQDVDLSNIPPAPSDSTSQSGPSPSRAAAPQPAAPTNATSQPNTAGSFLDDVPAATAEGENLCNSLRLINNCNLW